MPSNKKLLILPGDGIGPEVMAQVFHIIDWMTKHKTVSFNISERLVGGAAYDKEGSSISDETMEEALNSDAVLFGAVGGPNWDNVERHKRPEAAILRLRKDLDLFANLRPAKMFDALIESSSLKANLVKGLDILIKAARILKNKLENFKILAIGDCYENPDHYWNLIKENAVDDIFDLRTEFVADDQVNMFFSAADAVVLPYKSATQSGVVPVAYHFNRPVIVSDVGGLKEIVNEGKTGFTVQPNAQNFAEGIINYYKVKETTDFRAEIENYKQRFSWNEFINQIKTLVYY